METTDSLEYGNYYHIYNRGINGCNLFLNDDNYDYFLFLWEKYISPVAETYAWALMPNHFHILVRIVNLTGFENLSGVHPPHQYFSNLFNAYSKAINKRFNRHGALFERPFKRILVDSEEYRNYLVIYIHNNPVHHGFCNHPKDYPWTSYLPAIPLKPGNLRFEEVIGWFGSKDNFIRLHESMFDSSKFTDLTGFKNLSGL